MVPMVTASWTLSGDVMSGVIVSFMANGIDVDGDTLLYLWDFGDGDISM